MSNELDFLQSIEARTGNKRGDGWPSSRIDEISSACSLAGQAASTYGALSATARAELLNKLADAMEAARDQLIPIADMETGLGVPRLSGELDRTTFQLRGFAAELLAGSLTNCVDDAAISGPPPQGRPQLRRTTVPLGPVAMFAASNFPFAFSVLGGDTASVLAAGCPVVVKGHPGHPLLARETAAIAKRVVAELKLPEGTFQFVDGAAIEVGVALVNAPEIAAVAFTGSFKGGVALAKVANARGRPIPFYGELGSVNPVVVLPAALGKLEGAKALATSIGMGAGQFCTSPGLILVNTGAEGDMFIEALARDFSEIRPHVMLSPGIRASFDRGVQAWQQNPSVRTLTRTKGEGLEPSAFLGEVHAADFVADGHLKEEVFGSAALVVRVSSSDEVNEVLRSIGGSLTVTIWGSTDDGAKVSPDTIALVRTATSVAGRVLFAGVPTGVAVTSAQQHGGPFPSSTAPLTTSVGYAAVQRFQRPVALQEAPKWVLDMF